MKPYEYSDQYKPDEIFNLMGDNTNVYAMQSGTLSFNQNPNWSVWVMKMPRVCMYLEVGMDIGIFQNVMPRDRFVQLWSHLHLVNNLQKPADNNDVFFKEWKRSIMPTTDCSREGGCQQCMHKNDWHFSDTPLGSD